MRKILFLVFLMIFGISQISLSALVDNGDGTVNDTTTGLMWKKDTEPGIYTWANALLRCENLVYPESGGYSDWRLPNRNELRTLVEYSRYNPAIDPILGPTTVSSCYWSSTTNTDYTDCAWLMYFDYGNDDFNYKSYGHYVRAVRGGQSGSFADLIISKSGPGRVTGSAGDIDCGSTCSGSFVTGTSVTLTAVPDTGNIFYGWSGACSGTDPSCTVSMDSNKTVTATFTAGAGITVSVASGPSTSEAGGTVTFAIKPSTQPTANVTIGLSSSDTTEGTVSPSSVTFTPSNWNTDQIVTATGVDDAIVDGNIGYTIVTAAATSTDGNYNGLNTADVSLTNIDNECAATRSVSASTVAVAVTPPAGTSMWRVEENIPQGATVSQLSGSNATWDQVNGKISWWGAGSTQADLSYSLQGGDDCYMVNGTMYFDSQDSQVCGPTEVCTCSPHPGDANIDWRMILSEAISYLNGWQRGTNPMGYAIRSAYIRQNGETYCCDPSASAPLCWIRCNSSPDIDISPLEILSAPSFERSVLNDDTAIVTVQVLIDPGIDASAWGIEEHIAQGLEVHNLTGSNGVWDEIHRKISWWGTGTDPLSVSYQAKGSDGTFSLSGTGNLDGVDVTVSGSSQMSIKNGRVKGDLNSDGTIDLKDAVIAAKVVSGIATDDIRPDYVASDIDINGDGKVASEELVFVLQKVAGLR